MLAIKDLYGGCNSVRMWTSVLNLLTGAEIWLVKIVSEVTVVAVQKDKRPIKVLMSSIRLLKPNVET